MHLYYLMCNISNSIWALEEIDFTFKIKMLGQIMLRKTAGPLQGAKYSTEKSPKWSSSAAHLLNKAID